MVEATEGMLFRAWALVLCALSDYYETTAVDMVTLWHQTNAFGKSVSNYADIADELDETNRILGWELPWEHISSSNIRTEGELKKFRKKVHQNAMYAAFVLIAHPLFHEHLMPHEKAKAIFDSAYSLDEELYEKRISLKDIQEMLQDEYGILLINDGGQVRLEELRRDEEVS